MASQKLQVAALGRPFTLGVLYDSFKDELLPGITLWDNDAVQANIQEISKPKTDFKISVSDSIKEKSSLLDVKGSLKASFLCGLVEVGGSANYMNDQKKFNNQGRVTLQFNATTTFKQLSVTNLGMKHMQQKVIKRGMATHVVTAILYGANAFFVFDSEKLEADSIQDIQGSMEAMINKIPMLDFSTKCKIQLTDKEKALTNKLSCNFYGDFLLESNPVTFEEAVKTCAQLPKLLGQKRENAVPVKVWLLPLTAVDPEAVQLIREISNGLLVNVEEVLESVRQLEMRCNDSLGDRVVKKFPQIHQKLRRFQKLCNDNTSALRHTTAKKLPLIRAGKALESSLDRHFEERKKSPFNSGQLSKWMDHKEREINVVRSCVEMMEGTTKIVSNKKELDREVLAQRVDDALCFVFTSLESNDTYLDAMANYLSSGKLGSASEDQWCFSDEVLTRMREKARAFRDLAKALKNNNRFSFLVAAIANKKYKGATIYHYQDGVLVTDNFTKPDIPDVTAVKNRRDLIWHACDLTLDPNTAYNCLTLSKGNKMAAYTAELKYPDHPDRFDYHAQVMCREKLTGRHYWEVEWTNGYNDECGVAVTYKSIERKGSSALRLGQNKISWYFGIRYELYAWHDAKQQGGPFKREDCRRVGVYLDWRAGTLSFYRVSSDRLRHLHTFKTRFTEPVYTAFWFWTKSSTVFLCPFE